MGMSVGSSNGSGSKRRRRRRHVPISEINVTPFVDVMLVLLIIFMVSAPLLTVGVEVNLPETNAGSVDSDAKPLTLSIDKDGKIFLQESEITIEELAPRLAAVTEARDKFETRIFIRGDSSSPYDTIAKVLGEISAAGYKKFTMTSVPQTQ